MALNRTKVLEAAQKFLSKGQYDKAVAEYQKLVKEDPKDVRTLLKIGDLHTRREKKKEAIDTYRKVAELYATQGFFLKAVAVYKQILKLDPDLIAASEKLAQMYEELALTSDALSTYEQVAEAYGRGGDHDKALETMMRMVELDPDNIAVRIRYAEALSKAEKKEEAASAFAEGAALLKEQGRMDDYIRVCERQLYHQEDNIELAREISSLYLERGDPKRSLAKLQACFKADPRDIQTLEMLAEAFRQLKQVPKTISVLREIARIHQELGAEQARDRTLKRILELDPNDAEANQALGRGAPAPEPAPPPPAPASAPPLEAPPMPEPEVEIEEEPEFIEEDDDLLGDDDDDLLGDDGEEVLIVDDPTGVHDDPEHAADGPAPPPAEESVGERIGRLLADADAHEGYGLNDQVEELLKQALELDPGHVPARERLKDLYLTTGRQPEAAHELLVLADAWMETDMDRAVGYAKLAADLNPSDEAARMRLKALGVEHEADPLSGDTMIDDAMEPFGAEPSAPQADPLDDVLPPIDESAPPAAAAPDEPDPSPANLLDRPLSPDEFAAPIPAPPMRVRDNLQALLDRPILPDEFDGAPAAAPAPEPEPVHSGSTERADDAPYDGMAALLDEPISPDDFDGPVPDGRVTLPSDAEQLLAESIRPDDFGLSDERFDESVDESDDGVETGAPPAAEAPAQAQGPGTGEFQELGTGEIALIEDDEPDVAATGALPTDAQVSAAPPPPPPPPPPELLEEETNEPLDVPPVLFEADDDLAALPDVDDDFSEPGEDSVAPEPTQPGAPDLEDDSAPADLQSAVEEAAVLESVTDPPAPASDPAPLPEVAAPPPLVEPVAPEPEPEPLPTPVPVAPEPAPLPEPEPVAAADDAEPDEVELPEALEEALEEAEFFFAQGMIDEATDELREAMLTHGEHPILNAKLAEWEGEEEEEEPAAEASDDDSAFDIAKELAEELGEETAGGAEPPGGEAVDVEEVFAAFKKGVAEQISEEDSDTHFDLGIAYKEMGLLDDAMSEFRISLNNPKRACISYTIIGMCHLEKGDAPAAIAEFENGLACEERAEREELGLYFEIGAANEALGDVPKAIEAFEQVAAKDTEFRGVLGRLEALRAKRGKAANDIDDIDRAFDDLLGEQD